MKLNHINLVVTDVATTTTFFETHFGFKHIETKGDNVISILKNADNFTLVLMTEKQGPIVYPKDFHIGFMQESTDAVEAIYQQLKDAGIQVGAPRKIRASFGFYFYFDNLFIEVGCYLNEED